MDKDKAKVMKVPSTLGGKKVVKIGGKNADGYYNIFGVGQSDEDTTLLPKDIYQETKSVKEVILPSTLKEITGTSFDDLPELKKITIPSSMKKTAEYLCDTKWKSFKVSGKNKHYKVKKGFLLSKSGKTVYGLVKDIKKVKIPKGVKKVKKWAFWGSKADSIYLPKSIDSIGYQAFRSSKVFELSVSKKNKHYAMSGDCLYSKKSGRLVAAVNRNNKLVIPDVVTKLKEGTSAIGGKFTEIVIPKSVTLLKAFWAHDIFEEFDSVSEQEGVFYFKGTVPPVIEEGGLLAHIVYVPAKSYAAYKKMIGNGTIIRTTK